MAIPNLISWHFPSAPFTHPSAGLVFPQPLFLLRVCLSHFLTVFNRTATTLSGGPRQGQRADFRELHHGEPHVCRLRPARQHMTAPTTFHNDVLRNV